MKRISSARLAVAAVSAASAQSIRAAEGHARVRSRSRCRRHVRRPSPTPREKGDATAVKKLIAQGADVNIAAGRRHDRAALGGRARRLGDGHRADQGARERESDDAHRRVHAAARRRASTGNAGGREARCSRRAPIRMRPDANGATALHLAAAAGNPDAVIALLDKGANANAQGAGLGPDAARLRRRIRSRRPRSTRCSSTAPIRRSTRRS